jgi:hypothetical protein
VLPTIMRRGGRRRSVAGMPATPDVPPPDVLTLAERRAAARADKDFAESDRRGA